MQPITTRRRVSAAPAISADVAAATSGLPVLRFTMHNGLLEIEDAITTVRLLEAQQRDRLAAEAEQAALSTVYRLSGEPDESRPYGGLLTRRLDISERTARALITEGRLKYTCLGLKGYRVSELAVRILLGDKPSA